MNLVLAFLFPSIYYIEMNEITEDEITKLQRILKPLNGLTLETPRLKELKSKCPERLAACWRLASVEAASLGILHNSALPPTPENTETLELAIKFHKEHAPIIEL